MEDVPITFAFKNNTYTATFTPVQGAGSTAVWHLMVGKYYYGRLRISDFGWFFDSNSGMEELTDFFADYITAWYQ